MNSIYFYDTSIGRIGIADNGEAVIRLCFAGGNGGMGHGAGKAAAGMRMGGTEAGKRDARTNRADTWLGGDECPEGYVVAETALIKEAARQLNEYLDGNRKTFDIPLALEGTPFQKAVWKALTDIPYGQTRSYREIAESIGCPKACRAVGMANNKNPATIFVPCHRVIGSNGNLVGYAGGMDIKKRLLELERSVMKNIQ